MNVILDDTFSWFGTLLVSNFRKTQMSKVSCFCAHEKEKLFHEFLLTYFEKLLRPGIQQFELDFDLSYKFDGMVYKPDLLSGGYIFTWATSHWKMKHFAICMHSHSRFQTRNFPKYVCDIYSLCISVLSDAINVFSRGYVCCRKARALSREIVSPGATSHSYSHWGYI